VIELTDDEWSDQFEVVNSIISAIPKGVHSADVLKATRQIMNLFTGCQDCQEPGHPISEPCTNPLKPFTRTE
jgi:hypothetical protein